MLKDLPIGFNQQIELRHTGPAMHCAGDEEGSKTGQTLPSWSLVNAKWWWKKHKSKQHKQYELLQKADKNFPGGPGTKNPPFSAGAWHSMLATQWCLTLATRGL